MRDRVAQWFGLHVWALAVVLLVVVVVGAPIVEAVASVVGALEGAGI